jgi:hypothetical protein
LKLFSKKPGAAQSNAYGHSKLVPHPGLAYDLGRGSVDPAEKAAPVNAESMA